VDEKAAAVIGSMTATMGKVAVTRRPREGARESWISTTSRGSGELEEVVGVGGCWTPRGESDSGSFSLDPGEEESGEKGERARRGRRRQKNPERRERKRGEGEDARRTQKEVEQCLQQP
jgi:hypothetical protein